MRKITLITIACALLCLLAFALLLQSRRSARPQEARVAFCGFTNDTKGVRLAAFRVSNAGGGGLFRWPLYTIEERGRVAPLTRGSCASGVLAPGQSSICLLPVPTNSAPWRAVFAFSDNNWQRQLTGLPWARRLLPARFLSLPAREGMSDWVGDISAVPAAPYRDRVAAVIVRPQQPTNATAQTPGTKAVNSP